VPWRDRTTSMYFWICLLSWYAESWTFVFDVELLFIIFFAVFELQKILWRAVLRNVKHYSNTLCLFFRWDISVICPMIAIKLAVAGITENETTIFSDITTELTLKLFRSFKKGSVYGRKKTADADKLRFVNASGIRSF